MLSGLFGQSMLPGLACSASLLQRPVSSPPLCRCARQQHVGVVGQQPQNTYSHGSSGTLQNAIFQGAWPTKQDVSGQFNRYRFCAWVADRLTDSGLRLPMLDITNAAWRLMLPGG